MGYCLPKCQKSKKKFRRERLDHPVCIFFEGEAGNAITVNSKLYMLTYIFVPQIKKNAFDKICFQQNGAT